MRALDHDVRTHSCRESLALILKLAALRPRFGSRSSSPSSNASSVMKTCWRCERPLSCPHNRLHCVFHLLSSVGGCTCRRAKVRCRRAKVRCRRAKVRCRRAKVRCRANSYHVVLCRRDCAQVEELSSEEEAEATEDAQRSRRSSD
eukprot:6193229-Pleurochrysis_carterae.AAC.1